MAQLLYPQATITPPGTLSSWDELSGLCETLTALSTQVSRRLVQGAGPAVLVPLLREEVELARSLQEGLVRCGHQPSTPQSKARSQDLSGRLAALLETEQANQSLLKRRGIRLHGPRFPLSRLNCP